MADAPLRVHDMARYDTDPHRSTIWYCVLDRHWRQIYLGTDRSKAAENSLPGAAVGSANSMGGALRAAAIAAGHAKRVVK